ncbi:hypothetical protein D7X33_24935 [Butyricicoccus sp. 1XD8-22]|nr:hypothetical protein D7X33_24935 [Butyricicoccus sp. 1XD8-22]
MVYATTERQLRKYPFGQYILDFVEMRNPPNARWEFLYMHSFPDDGRLINAEFDIPSMPGSRLFLKFKVDDSQPGPPAITFIDVKTQGIL